MKIFLLIAFLTLPTLLMAEEATQTRRGPGLAFICLKSLSNPDDAQLKKAFASWFPAERINEIEHTTREGRSAFSLEVEGYKYLVAHSDAPIPEADIKNACANSFYWPDAAKTMADQKAHLIIMVSGKFESPAVQAIALSRAVAALTECYPETLGVYWGYGNIVQEPESFRKAIRKASPEEAHLPILCWIGFPKDRNPEGGINIYTSGLDAFGVMELEVINSKKPPLEILQKLAELSAYLILNGNVIADGDTIGENASDKIKTSYSASVAGRKTKVIRVEF